MVGSCVVDDVFTMEHPISIVIKLLKVVGHDVSVPRGLLFGCVDV
jgi:hypothetical protein